MFSSYKFSPTFCLDSFSLGFLLFFFPVIGQHVKYLALSMLCFVLLGLQPSFSSEPRTSFIDAGFAYFYLRVAAELPKGPFAPFSSCTCFKVSALKSAMLTREKS